MTSLKSTQKNELITRLYWPNYSGSTFADPKNEAENDTPMSKQ